MEDDPYSHESIVSTSPKHPDHILDEARSAVANCRADDPERLPRFRRLADLLWERFQETDECNRSLPNECIKVEREICDLCPSGHTNRRVRLYGDLAVSLHKLFGQIGDESLLNEAISLQREAVSLTPSGHPHRARVCQNLAVSLHTCFEQFGDQSLLEEAISLLREVLL
jgi:hypothetical protein